MTDEHSGEGRDKEREDLEHRIEEELMRFESSEDEPEAEPPSPFEEPEPGTTPEGDTPIGSPSRHSRESGNLSSTQPHDESPYHHPSTPIRKSPPSKGDLGGYSEPESPESYDQERSDDAHGIASPEAIQRRRDADSMAILGIFLCILAIPVLIGTAFAEKQHAMIINVVSGLVLLAIGVGLALRGRFLRRT